MIFYLFQAKYDEDYDPSLAFRVLEEDFQQVCESNPNRIFMFTLLLVYFTDHARIGKKR